MNAQSLNDVFPWHTIVLQKEGIGFAVFDEDLMLDYACCDFGKAGGSLSDLIPELEGMEETLRAAMQKGEEMTIPRLNRQKEGQTYYVDLRLIPFEEKLLVVFKDISPHGWLEQAETSLRQVGEWAGGLETLAVENLEGYPLDFYEPVFERVPVSRCVDLGHLWLDGHDPLPYLRRALAHTRVIHIHGLAERDHRSLAFLAPERLRAVLEELIHARYDGVLTIEVFSEGDFLSSLQALQAAAQDS